MRLFLFQATRVRKYFADDRCIRSADPNRSKLITDFYPNTPPRCQYSEVVSTTFLNWFSLASPIEAPIHSPCLLVQIPYRGFHPQPMSPCLGPIQRLPSAQPMSPCLVPLQRLPSTAHVPLLRSPIESPIRSPCPLVQVPYRGSHPQPMSSCLGPLKRILSVPLHVPLPRFKTYKPFFVVIFRSG